ncbi:unnamed protein product [Amoebophrya sp. A120]|nr:unnamed protein product [Amoebophrya sp. A120]|eukprot:GSA120T00010132001.1
MKTMDFESRRRAFKQTQDLNDVRRKREDEEVQLRKTEKEVLLQKKRRDCRSDGCSTAPAAPASTSTSAAASASSSTTESMGSTSTHGNYNSAASRTTSNNSCASATNYTAQKILGQRNTLLSTTDEEHSSGAMNSKMSLNLNASASTHLQLQSTDQHGAAVGNNINSPCVFRDHHDHGPPEDCSPLLHIHCKRYNVWIWKVATCHAKSGSCQKYVLHDYQKMSTFGQVQRQFVMQDK